MSTRLSLLIATLALTPALGMGALLASGVDLYPTTDYHPTLLSQGITCDLVDEAIAQLPRGDGDGTLTEDELGPGGWHHGITGRRFVTLGFTRDTKGRGYDITAGRSKVGANRDIVNDYPVTLDQRAGFWAGDLELSKGAPTLTVSGNPGMRLPVHGPGAVRIELADDDGDGVLEGCGNSPYTMTFRSVGREGSDLMQRDYFKVAASLDDYGTVTYLEITEIDLFRELPRDRLFVASHRR